MKTQTKGSTSQKVFLKVMMLILLLVTIQLEAAAKRKITGKVQDAFDGRPMSGVVVTIQGTTSGTVSDNNGLYTIMIPDSSIVLVFSYLGYISYSFEVKKGNVVDVALTPQIENLEEIEVVANGIQKKSSCTGAIAICADRMMSNSFPPPAYNSVYYNPSNESYKKINENGFRSVMGNPLSTFSIDVDKASYSNMRRFINQGQLPPADAVRIEEMVNYFDYNYPQPLDEHPFSINTEYTDCPWQQGHKLLRIGLQGKKIPIDNLPASNLVFLLDVSGSMGEPNKLPLVIAAFKLLVNNLRAKDHVAIVVYAGAAGLVLPSTAGNEKNKIIDALNSLHAGGSTAGCQGITLAYRVAKENFIKEGNNRVILATDGDFNVGISGDNQLEDFIAEKRKDDIFLTCLGFGMGNYKDSKMETLADKGNGNYAYIDDIVEANKVFVNEFGGTLFTIAKDVKIQIEFNPTLVQSYRLVGYENRLLNNEDFKDDTKDAGELGSGHTVTALYEIIPSGIKSKFVPFVDALKYQDNPVNRITGNEVIATVKFRYKKPDGETSIEMVHPISNTNLTFDRSSLDTRFAASVAMFGMILTNSEFKGSSNFKTMLDNSEKSRGIDKEGYRVEFIRLAKTACNLGLRVSTVE